MRELSACAITRAMNELKECGVLLWHYRDENLKRVGSRTRRICEIGKEKLRFSSPLPAHLIPASWQIPQTRNVALMTVGL